MAVSAQLSVNQERRESARRGGSGRQQPAEPNEHGGHPPSEGRQAITALRRVATVTAPVQAANVRRRTGRRQLRQRSVARRPPRSSRTGFLVPRPHRLVRWQLPACQPIFQRPHCRRHILLSLASGYEVGELELLQSSPLLAVTAPWLGLTQAEQPIRYFAGASVAARLGVGAATSQAVPTAAAPAQTDSLFWHSVAGRFRALFLSPRYDPLPPCAPVQELLADWLRQCVRLRLQCWIQTRGVMLPALRQALVECRPHIRVTLALSTLDDQLARALEPGAAPPLLRLRQLQWLLRHSIPTQVTLAPLLPDLTDTRANLLPVLTALRELQIARATFGYLVLDPLGTWQHPEWTPQDWAESVAALYEMGQLRRWGPNTWARCLAWRERQRRYASLIAWAAELGLDLRPSTLADPDFRMHPSESGANQARLLWPE
ncbi:hypothetical protein HRbin36_01267 [bacterium HR36]|nr:hypothetical protein HRbin36_01267 [bacterium HR36]